MHSLKHVLGIKSAAVRKLRHELGIVSPEVCIENIKYLGRIHYCAADDSTTGPSTTGSNESEDDGAWGEHEIDYILFMKATVDLAPNPEEVNFKFYHFLILYLVLIRFCKFARLESGSTSPTRSLKT